MRTHKCFRKSTTTIWFWNVTKLLQNKPRFSQRLMIYWETGGSSKLLCLSFNPLSSCHESCQINFHPSPSLLSHGSFPLMHGEVVIYILKCQASQNTYVLLNGVFHGKRWNPAQGACLLRPANQHRDAPKPEIIPFICCNWVSISAIKNRWWKTEALDRNTSLLCVCVASTGLEQSKEMLLSTHWTWASPVLAADACAQRTQAVRALIPFT